MGVISCKQIKKLEKDQAWGTHLGSQHWGGGGGGGGGGRGAEAGRYL
jgi:hypothetical protein